MLDRALGVVLSVGGFGGECPGGLVAGTDVYAAEEDGVESGKVKVGWSDLVMSWAGRK